jgi:glycosidase
MAAALALLTASACAVNDGAQTMQPAFEPTSYVKLDHPEWSRDAAIYQINTRQFTPQGTLAAARAQLPRLQALGVRILWLMPVQPIGEHNRKGSLGSPYSVQDYLAVNPEFGDLDDFKEFVAAAHELGMYVILDWVANHTAWDNPLTAQHPEWFSRDYAGRLHPPVWTDWSDVVQLDFDQPALWRYMSDAMAWWVTETGIDGFRCDVAGFVPVEFWNGVRGRLDRIKPVFLLAEWKTRDLHARAFDASYSWDWHETVRRIAQGEADVTALAAYHYDEENAWPRDAMRMLFVSNHDKNAWDGTQFEAFGPALENAIVLSVASRGIPLIYNGQEAGNPKRLAFFERDPIEWRDHPVGALYQRLFALKRANRALWNGGWGAPMEQVANTAPDRVFSFYREEGDDAVFGVFNFSAEAVSARFAGERYTGDWRDFGSGAETTLAPELELDLPAWSWRLFTRN